MLTHSARLPLALCALLGAALLPAAARAIRCPNLVIILDKSGSMADAPDNTSPPPGGSKWEIAKKALGTLLDQNDGHFPIGLAMFASDMNCGAARLDVPPAYGTKAQIVAAIGARSPDSNTPTAESIDAVRMQPALQDKTRGQYFLLITDGQPNCSDISPPNKTVASLTAARMQNPPITTFVVGFGALPPAEATAMDKMADAGGHPVTGMQHHFYAVESPDSLQMALNEIVGVVMGEFGGLCDDTCYSNGCPSGQQCIRAQCQQNPCANLSCPRGSYCYTDGVSPGMCVKVCPRECPKGTRCQRGACITDPCGAACLPGTTCNAMTKTCEVDPLCANLPPDKQCRGSSRCEAGQCVDDPCLFINCPSGTRCVPWDGSCQVLDTGTPDLGAGSGDTTGDMRRGCAAAPGGWGAPWSGPGAAHGAAALAFAAALFGLRRRRIDRSPGAS